MCVKARFYAKICQLITTIKTGYENYRKAMFTYSKRREHTFIYFTNIQDHKCNVTRSCMRFKGLSRFLLHVDSKIANSFAM